MKKSDVPVKILKMKPARKVIIDLLHLGLKVSRIHAYGEDDCTEALQRLNVISEKLGRKISFTAYLATCWASTIYNHKIMHAYRRRNKIVLFEDVDVACVVERDIVDKKVPTSYIIREAQNKNVVHISDEIQEAKQSKSETAATSTKKLKQSKASLITRLPGFIRRFILKHMTKNPWLKKEIFGTVGLSSIGMFTMGSGSAIPVTVHSSTFIVGGIAKKPWVVGNEIKIRDIITGTISMDHDLVDGGPAARAIAELRNKIRECHGLNAIEKELGIQYD
ncbi:MAG: 2-oxo acid dehydrogenase subunit E2 [Candidatus Lokiarchaeota archaeon]|nr:2-oxo acid dehydrogenase subunit E2 [Candidatus Lokiarchaeota archaeon]